MDTRELNKILLEIAETVEKALTKLSAISEQDVSLTDTHSTLYMVPAPKRLCAFAASPSHDIHVPTVAVIKNYKAGNKSSALFASDALLVNGEYLLFSRLAAKTESLHELCLAKISDLPFAGNFPEVFGLYLEDINAIAALLAADIMYIKNLRVNLMFARMRAGYIDIKLGVFGEKSFKQQIALGNIVKALKQACSSAAPEHNSDVCQVDTDTVSALIFILKYVLRAWDRTNTYRGIYRSYLDAVATALAKWISNSDDVGRTSVAAVVVTGPGKVRVEVDAKAKLRLLWHCRPGQRIVVFGKQFECDSFRDAVRVIEESTYNRGIGDNTVSNNVILFFDTVMLPSALTWIPLEVLRHR